MKHQGDCNTVGSSGKPTLIFLTILYWTLFVSKLPIFCHFTFARSSMQGPRTCPSNPQEKNRGHQGRQGTPMSNVHQSFQRSGYDYRNGAHGGDQLLNVVVRWYNPLWCSPASTVDRDGCSVGKDVVNLNERVDIRITFFACIGK